MSPVRVLVVDDSALMRKLIPQILQTDSSIEVVGTAMDGNFGLRKIEDLKPQVVTLDLEMPGMNGIELAKYVADTCSDTKILLLSGQAAVWDLLRQARLVADSDASVLIFGESGTGKELIARAIHRLSQRKDAPFIRINCAAIPTGLLESELFGHEKGAFTGAISQKIGRMELADGGTLFLDEIGEIPLELQAKLLRVLQDQEFERLGSNRTIKVDMRVVAATNRNLAERIAQNQFRSDLYYRLSVFPIVVPALRERKEDIPLLVRYFVRQICLRMDRHVESIPPKAMDALVQWHWPGNVRELENLIKRYVILGHEEVITNRLTDIGVALAGWLIVIFRATRDYDRR